MKSNDVMSENRELILRCYLNDIPGIGISTLVHILKSFESIEHFLSCDISTWETCQIKEKILTDLIKFKKLFDSNQIASHPAIPKDPNILFTSYGLSQYPKIFYAMKDPPFLWYMKGNIDLFTMPRKLAVVGTRDPSIHGKEFTKRLGKYCGEHDIITISGGAVGIDTEVHRSTIESQGKTLCVLGMSLEQFQKNLIDYFIQNQSLIVSEFPLHIKAEPFFFVKRNRLISYLSDGVVVVEAGEKSGALITAQYAKEQGKPLFAVPGSPIQPKSVGTNRLIKNGAKCFTHFDDDLKYLIHENEMENQSYVKRSESITPTTLPIFHENHNNEKHVLPAFRRVYDTLSLQPKNVEEIAELAKQPTSIILEQLTLLELDGHIASLPGGLYLRR